jgi:hypothetical protein
MPKKTYTPEQKQKRAALLKEWKIKNAEHVKRYNDAYLVENREYNKERCKKWKKNNPEKMATMNREWNINNRGKRNQLNNEWRKAHPEYRPDYLLGYNYNITIEDYARMLDAQNRLCATCEAPEPNTGRLKRFCVDHDHSCCAGNKSCGKCIRGLICNSCNRALGLVRDNQTVLRRMIEYLCAGGSAGVKFIEEQVEECAGL